MNFAELFIISVSLSMDAFAVAVCKGLSMKKMNLKNAIIVGLYFGSFQALMPLIGYTLGVQFSSKISFIDHWIAFILLGAIGINMIREANNDADTCDASVSYKSMTVLALATSIDALAIGVTFAFLNVSIGPAVGFIGATTFVISVVGVKLGHVFGTRYKAKAEIAGGVALILMGIKILLEHLGVFSF